MNSEIRRAKVTKNSIGATLLTEVETSALAAGGVPFIGFSERSYVEYDGLGRVQSSFNQDGQATEFQYDDSDNSTATGKGHPPLRRRATSLSTGEMEHI